MQQRASALLLPHLLSHGEIQIQKEVEATWEKSFLQWHDT